MSFFKQASSRDPLSFVLRWLVYLAAGLAGLATSFIVVYILLKGLPYLHLDLFSWTYSSTNVSMLPALLNTVLMSVLSLALALPIGIGASIYLTEYASSSHPLVTVVRLATETLSGIPSIVYGLFGALFFVKFLHMGLSMIAGAATLSIMILPLIMRTTEEALLSVEEGYREGSFALGAGKLRTIFRVVLPSALPGIFSGIVLALGRVIGESAALIFTAGTVAEVASRLTSSGRTLAVHMYVISGEGMYVNQTYATAVVLLLLVIVMNLLSEWIVGRLGRNRYE
ncbi:phosphate ABC transporter permease PstA [Streptococcus cuniculi]|uniref:phosphate ABC transporter permease PstA n=1 Tax=Streptococcus cuniculi TaxID=1432788 RepID=UPI000B30E62B|nr:phosphate ABC transporter permease PstA [Streptococcus cuniculi]